MHSAVWAMLMIGSASMITAAEPQVSDTAKGNFWDFATVEWGDGRPFAETPQKGRPWPQNGPQGWSVTYPVTVPADGWYELILGGVGCMDHDLAVDGVYVYRYGEICSGKTDGDFLAPGQAKVANLFLTQGVHELRLRRVGRPSFPHQVFETWELHAADNQPESCIAAAKTLVDVVRTTDPLKITVRGGGTAVPVTYQILKRSLLAPEAEPEPTGVAVEFPASATPVEKTVEIPLPVEGVWDVRAAVNGKLLRPCEFRIGECVSVDVSTPPATGGKPTLAHEIDCVTNTIDGKPVALGTDYWECNGTTRVTESKAGKYRESGDCQGPDAEVPNTPTELPRCYSGFAYRITGFTPNRPCLLEVEFPDDARRSATIPVIMIDPATGGFVKDSSAYSKSYETGGMHPLSFGMRMHRSVFWAASPVVQVCVLSQQVGHRAAAARIRISVFDGELPATKVPQSGGRVAAHWYEEALSWRFLTNVHLTHPDTPWSVKSFIGFDRWARLVRYFGFNGISGLGVGYQEVFNRSDVLDGFLPSRIDVNRLMALTCEKYGMRFTPEVFPCQWYMNLVVLPREGEKPEDVRAVSCHGALTGTGFAPCNLNALHPAVQQRWLDGIGEIADKLRDSPAFAGVCVRSDAWQFRGDFHLPGLHWGYGDWTIRQFEKDTGIAVPTVADAPDRFIKRFDFLCGPAMRERWLAWRCDRTMNYHLRLRDRIRGDRNDLLFVLVGDGDCDPVYAIPDDPHQRFLEMGVDLDRLRTTDGVAVMPMARYGTRNVTSNEQAIYDGFLDPDNVGVGAGRVRSFAAYMVYHELGTQWPCDKLGVTGVSKGKMPYYCSAVPAAGRNSLEKFAVVLAEQDSAYLRDGGNADMFGDPEIWQPWFAEFASIPAVPFEPFPGARDPVAVWWKAEVSGFSVQVSGNPNSQPDTRHPKPETFFYAVNREQYPIDVRITLTGADRVTAPATGQTQALDAGGVLRLTLEPYGLHAFRTTASAAIAAVDVTVPQERIEHVRRRLAFAQDLADAITTGPNRGDVSNAERSRFRTNLDAAWNAFAQGHYWRARTALSMAPMMRVYEKLARLPDGQVLTTFPSLLVPRPAEHWEMDEPVVTGDDLRRLLAPDGPRTELAPSRSFNPEWDGAQALRAADGRLDLELDVPADGCWLLRFGHVAATPGVTTAAIDGKSLALPCITVTPNAPETVAFPALELTAGKHRLTLRRDGAFGVYALQFLPVMQPMPNAVWSTIGPFTGFWGLHMSGRDNSGAAVKRSLDCVYPPEAQLDLTAVYKNTDGSERRWSQAAGAARGKIADRGIDMPARTRSSSADINYAVTYIYSDTERTALFRMAVDWWARAYLNGERLATNIKPEVRDDCGADFTTWYAVHGGVLKLKKGWNTLLVKQQGGSGGSAFAAYLTAAPNLALAPTSGGVK